MTSYYEFDTQTSTFKYFYRDDTYRSFGKGNFQLSNKLLTMKYDTIICDNPIIERLDNDLINDSTTIAFFLYSGFSKRIDLISNGERIYSNRSTNSDSIIDEYLLIKIPQKLDSIEIQIYDHVGLHEEIINKFVARLYQKPFCNIYYYPCNSSYSYKSHGEEKLKIRWKGSDSFELKGELIYGFKKIK